MLFSNYPGKWRKNGISYFSHKKDAFILQQKSLPLHIKSKKFILAKSRVFLFNWDACFTFKFED